MAEKGISPTWDSNPMPLIWKIGRLEDLFDGVYGAVELHRIDVW